MNRSVNLDLIRILAAGFVFLVHLGQYTKIPINTQNGFYGVWLFFILSGYLIYKSIDSGINKGENLSAYYKKRVIRIVPLYFIVLTVIWCYELLKGLLLDGEKLVDLVSIGGVCGAKYIRYYTFMHMILPSNNYDLWNNRYAMWTMSCFAVFYVIAPLIKRVTDSFLKSLIVLIVFFEIKEYVPGAIRNTLDNVGGIDLQSFPEFNPLCMMYLFWIGVCTYYAIKEGKELVYALILVTSFTFYIFRGNEYEVIFAMLLMIAVSMSDIRVSDKFYRVIATASKCSFPLYLTHIICFDMLTRVFSFTGVQNIVVKVLLMSVLSLVTAYIFYKIVSPIENKFKKMLL